MNGEPLPREHGFPVRMVVPGLYGFISATKWLTKLTLTTYADAGGVLDRARLGDRRPDQDLGADRHPAGAGRPGHRRRRHRRHRLGPGARRDREGPGPDRRRAAGRTRTSAPTAATTTGASGSTAGRADSGSHRIAARAVSGDGEPQTAARAEPFPDGASGLHEFIVNVA